LKPVQYAVRNAQPAHIRVLVRRDVEEAVIAPAKIVRRLRIFVRRRLLLQCLVGVERLLLALDLLLIGELAATRDDAVLRLQRGGIGTDRLARGRWRAAHRAGDALDRLGDLHPGDKALEIALLLRLELAGCQIDRGLEVDLAHSAGTWLGMVNGAGAESFGLCVR